MGVFGEMSLTLGKWEFQNFHILAGLRAGPGPGRPGRPSPEDAFESPISDFEIRLMNEMLRAAGLRISFRRAKIATSVVGNVFPCPPEHAWGYLGQNFLTLGK